MSQEQPGRYRRSAGGLVAAMLVTVVVVGGLVLVRDLFRNDLTTRPAPVDYLAAVQYAQDSDVEVVYPGSVPEGWIATSAGLTPGKRLVWGVGLLTDEERFVGVRHEQRSLDHLLETYVDEDTSALPEAGIDSPVADSWQVFEDEGGDRAYAAEVGETVVLVYGSAPQEDLEQVVGALTTRRLPPGSG